MPNLPHGTGELITALRETGSRTTNWAEARPHGPGTFTTIWGQKSLGRDFGNNNQASAANRAWMPCLGNHEVEFNNGSQGFTSYLTRYQLPENDVPGFRGRCYSFKIGGALCISLGADDVIYQDGAAFVGGPNPRPARPTCSPGRRPTPTRTR